MTGIDRLRAYAKRSGLRVVSQDLYTTYVPEPLVKKTSLTLDGARIKLCASASYFFVAIDVDCGDAFSIGAPDAMFAMHRRYTPAIPWGVPIYVSSERETRLELAAWLDREENLAAFRLLSIVDGEAIHVLNNGVRFTLLASRELEDSLLKAARSFARAVQTIPFDDSSSDEDDCAQLPAGFRVVVESYRSLAQSDDEKRSELSAGLSKSDKRKFVAEMRPILPAINDYLNRLKDPWPDCALTLSSLAELAAELILEE